MRLCVSFLGLMAAIQLCKSENYVLGTAKNFTLPYVQQFLNKTAMELVARTPLNFLTTYERDHLREILLERDAEELEEIEKNRLFKIGVMAVVMKDLYEYDYTCETNVTHLGLKFITGSHVDYPEKWILSFFT